MNKLEKLFNKFKAHLIPWYSAKTIIFCGVTVIVLVLLIILNIRSNEWLSFWGSLIGAMLSFGAASYQINKQHELEIKSKRPHIVIKDKYINNIKNTETVITNMDNFLSWNNLIAALTKDQPSGFYGDNINLLFLNNIKKYLSIENYSPNICYDLMVTVYTTDGNQFSVNSKSITTENGLNIFVPSNPKIVEDLINQIDDIREQFGNINTKTDKEKQRLLSSVVKFTNKIDVNFPVEVLPAISTDDFDEIFKTTFVNSIFSFQSDIHEGKGGALYKTILDGSIIYGNPSSLYNIKRVKLNLTTESNEKFEYIYSVQNDYKKLQSESNPIFEMNTQYVNHYKLEEFKKVDDYDSSLVPLLFDINP